MDKINLNIHDLSFFPLKVIENEKGKLFHHVRADSSYFSSFGEIYYALTYPGIIKGWKIHNDIEQLYSVPVGMIRVVLYDLREGSSSCGKFDIVDFGENDYGVLKIPPKIWYAFTPLGNAPALIANQINVPYDPNQSYTEPLERFLPEEAKNLWRS